MTLAGLQLHAEYMVSAVSSREVFSWRKAANDPRLRRIAKRLHGVVFPFIAFPTYARDGRNDFMNGISRSVSVCRRNSTQTYRACCSQYSPSHRCSTPFHPRCDQTSETPRASALRFCTNNLRKIESTLGLEFYEGEEEDADASPEEGFMSEGRQSLREACTVVVEDAINAVLLGLRERVREEDCY